MNAKINSLFLSVFISASAFAQGATDAPVQVPGATAGAPGSPSGWSNLLLMGGMIFFMWFFVIRPQSKRQKEHKTFVDSLQSGMEVVTSSGIIGRVTNVSENIVTVDLGNTAVRVLKSAISGKLDNKTVEALATSK